jgi:hypothetical protein
MTLADRALLAFTLAVSFPAQQALAQAQPTPEQRRIAEEIGDQLLNCAVVYQFDSDLNALQAGAERAPPVPRETNFLLGAATFALSDLLGGMEAADVEVNRRAEERLDLLWNDYFTDEDADRLRADWGIAGMLDFCAGQVEAVTEMTGISPHTEREDL